MLRRAPNYNNNLLPSEKVENINSVILSNKSDPKSDTDNKTANNEKSNSSVKNSSIKEGGSLVSNKINSQVVSSHRKMQSPYLPERFGTNPTNNIRIHIEKPIKKLYVSWNPMLQEFTFVDNNNIHIGSFNIDQILHNIIGGQFLAHVIKDVQYSQSKQLIEAMIGKRKNDIIVLSDYSHSPFMGNIGMLMILANTIERFETNRLKNEIITVPTNKREITIQRFKRFYYTLLNYILQLIALTADQLGENTSKKELLLQYTTTVIHKISLFVQDQLSIMNSKIQKLSNMERMENQMGKILQEKMVNLTKLISQQNEYLREQNHISQPIVTPNISNVPKDSNIFPGSGHNLNSITQPNYQSQQKSINNNVQMIGGSNSKGNSSNKINSINQSIHSNVDQSANKNIFDQDGFAQSIKTTVQDKFIPYHPMKSPQYDV